MSFGIDYRPWRPARDRAAIAVPQAHHALANGPRGDIHILYTQASPGGLALALIGTDTRKSAAPRLILAHLDGREPTDAAMSHLLRSLGPAGNRRAYLLPHISAAALAGQVQTALRQVHIPCQTDPGPHRTILALDLTDGYPLQAGAVAAVPHYRPDLPAEALYRARLTASRRGNYPALAFDLSQDGCLLNYTRRNPGPASSRACLTR